MSKATKKAILLVLLCLLIFSLTACDRMSSIYYTIDRKILRIELIEYNNPEAKKNPLEKYDFDLDKLEVLEVLEAVNNSGFMTELYDISIPNAGVHKQFLCSHDGIGIRIIYVDNSFQIITLTDINGNDCFFTGEYDSAMNQVQTKDEKSSDFATVFNNLLNKSFRTKIG